MDLAPHVTTFPEPCGYFGAELIEMTKRPVIFEIPQRDRPIRATQLEPRFTSFAEDVDVRRRMIV